MTASEEAITELIEGSMSIIDFKHHFDMRDDELKIGMIIDDGGGSDYI